MIFENEKEHQKFRTYVEKNWNKKNEFANDIRIPYMDQLPGYNMNVFQEEYSNMQILRRMLEAFREE